MGKILISYRREDSQDVTGRIYDRLVRQFGQDAVVKDVDSIPLGVDFRTYLNDQVSKCEVFLAVIGRNWMGGKGRKGKSRLEDPEDFVRIEIETALKRSIPVIPVLVGGAKIPTAERLPAGIQDLSYRHGMDVRSDPDFHRDMDRLITSFEQRIRGPQVPTDPGTKSKPEGNKAHRFYATTDMVKVPKGPFLYGDERTRATIDHDYWLDKYPVTNEKYRAFIEADGYATQEYWSPEGWKWKTKNNVTSPEYWNHKKWNQPDHPTVGVSYYEAEAYAKWVGKRLPTEQEWEKAARGEDGRQYPWGDEFDKNKCNSDESGIGQTTPVNQYPTGVSPYGCYDMAGNVWEWCAGWYNKGGFWHVIRGGAWDYKQGYLRVSYRYRPNSVSRNPTIGFRLVLDVDK